MIAAGSWVCCPSCRLYADAFASEVPPDLSLPCPWCRRSAPAEQWAKCAEETRCSECQHPATLHLCYYTPDGMAPQPGVKVVADASTCSACGCAGAAGKGARVLRANG